MAKKQKPPFSNGMTEEELIAYLKAQRPDTFDENGVRHRTKWKWSEDDIDLRNQLIIYWITKDNMSRMEVVNMIMQVFGINRSNAFVWSGEAISSLNEGFEEYKESARQTQIERIEKLIKECRLSGRLKEAAMFTEQLNKIYGLYTDTKKVEVSADGPIKFEFDK